MKLERCFEIRDVIDPSTIYADKSHSINKAKVVEHVRTRNPKPIPSLKVLNTLLEKPATDWSQFLKQIDEHGLDNDALVIGLKAKERELKGHGRFIALMSWELREYFVVTEYLIKTHFVPLFQGMTMADDMNELIKKMLNSTTGQGLADYSRVCYANHVDYDKWNNHQRHEATYPVFHVMDQCLGFNGVISRTHEFFKKILYYCPDRPDLMRAVGETLENATENMACWQGQDGGIDGLRQKAWTILGVLTIQRESKVRNAHVQMLASGDNQVICTMYKLPEVRDDMERDRALMGMFQNNAVIMNAIENGSKKMGLILKPEEQMLSADLLIYGNVPIYRGMVRNVLNRTRM